MSEETEPQQTQQARMERGEELNSYNIHEIRKICEHYGIRWQPDTADEYLVSAILAQEFGGLVKRVRAQDRYDELKKWNVEQVIDLAVEIGAIPDRMGFKGTKGDLIGQIIIAERADGRVIGYVRQQAPRGEGEEITVQANNVLEWKVDGKDVDPAAVRMMFGLEPGSPIAPFAERSAVLEWLISEGVPRWLEEFAKDNADYGDQHTEFGLGARAEFIGLWRKIWKLKRAIWDGKPMTGESPERMLDDMIATCFLIKHIYAVEQAAEKP